MRSIIRKFLIALLSVSLFCSAGCSSEEKSSDSSDVPEIKTDSSIDATNESMSEDSDIYLPPSDKQTVDSTDETDGSVNTDPEEPSVSSNISNETSETFSAPSLPDDAGFVVHFIDVGQGDAALIVCDGETMLIDGGSSDNSSIIYSYLKKNGITKLNYVVGTHPDDDHIGGLSGALNYASVDRAFCSVNEYDGWAFENFQKYLNKQNVAIEVPSPGTTLSLGSADVTVLAPIETLEEVNNNSIVIRIVYGNTSFMFTGDAEFSEESLILASGQEIDSDVLKVGHHGSEYSTSTTFLKEVSPSVAVISCGTENDYGFPKQRVLDSLKKQDVEVFRTDLSGDILIYSNGEDLYVSTEKALPEDPFTAPQPLQADPSEIPDCDYVVNRSSGKFHVPGCESVAKMKEKNKWCFKGDRETLIAEGYEPCQICNP